MNQEIKDQWIAALRSGEYKQTRGNLYRCGRYCCLGVLCDLAEKAGVVEIRQVNGHVAYGTNDEFAYALDSTDVLPKSVQAWAGLDDENPAPEGSDYALSEYNDSLGRDFNDIADLIEQGM